MGEPQDMDLGRMLAYCGHLGRQYSLSRLQQEGYDITPVQTRALACLSCAQKEVSQRDLERELRLRPSTVNGIVGRLEAKGYISRRASPTDGRCRLVSLTEAGRAQFSAVCTSLEQTNRRFCASLDEAEQTQLRELLSRIIADLENEVNKV